MSGDAARVKREQASGANLCVCIYICVRVCVFHYIPASPGLTPVCVCVCLIIYQPPPTPGILGDAARVKREQASGANQGADIFIYVCMFLYFYTYILMCVYITIYKGCYPPLGISGDAARVKREQASGAQTRRPSVLISISDPSDLIEEQVFIDLDLYL